MQVITNTEVAKVNLENKDGKYVATGVTLINGDIITAEKEVIVSAGTIKSPPLLELSGIGNGTILRAGGVAQKIDLPGVGENLQDHPRIQASYLLHDNYTSFDKLKYNTSYAAAQLALWEDDKYSAYDYAASAYSYQNWSSFPDDPKSALTDAATRVAAATNNVVNDKKLTFLTNRTLTPGIAQSEIVLSDGYTGNKGYPKPGDALYGKGFTTLIAALMHPLARGYVHINSSDASAYPVYNPAYADNEYDLQGLITMAKYIRTVAQTAPFSYVWKEEYEPGLDVVQTDEEWKTYVLNNTQPFYHPVGTCAMLPRENAGVVDPELRVYGTENLRVVDASVIPILVSAHPQTGIYGIAERAAVMIAEAWR